MARLAMATSHWNGLGFQPIKAAVSAGWRPCQYAPQRPDTPTASTNKGRRKASGMDMPWRFFPKKAQRNMPMSMARISMAKGVSRRTKAMAS